MFSQSADKPAADQTPDPIGMRELPPQPAKPVMPVYTMPAPTPVTVGGEPAGREDAPGPDDSVIARDDHVEGTFTSRGTVVVMGSVKGRIEAVRVRIEDGARVEADVIVDEAVIAGEFSGNLTCRERLEARASGRINGRVETYKLMLHEGASVEGEMHMLTEAPRDASETIRGSAPLRGQTGSERTSETPGEARARGAAADAGPAGSTLTGAGPASSAAPTPASPALPVPVSAATAASTSGSGSSKPSAPVGKPAPTVAPSSAARSASSAVARTATTAVVSADGPTGSGPAPSPATGVADVAAPVRSRLAETLRTEALRVAPRATTSTRPSTAASSGGAGRTVSNGSRARSGTTTTGF